MEDHNPYENVGSLKQGARNEHVQRGYTDSKMYMVPNAAQYDEDNEYEELQISTDPSKKQLASEQGKHASKSTNTGADYRVKDIIEKKRGCIVVCILLTVFAVIILIALAVGALSLRGSSKADASLNRLHDEMRSLNSQFVQLHSDAQRNISQLMSQLSRLSITHSLSINRLSNSAYQVSISVSRVSTSVSRLSNSAYSLSTSGYSVSSSASRMSTSISRLSTSLSSSVSRLSYSSVYSLSTSVRRLSTSVSQLSYTSVRQLSTSVSIVSASVALYH